MDNYSPASSVLRSRAKPDRPAKLEVWARSTAKAVMFDGVKELVARRMRRYREHNGIRINSSVP